jgi:hypothetical protein
VKLAAEPAAIWLRLARMERPSGRVATLEAAARALPSEAEAFERALRLQRELPRSPEPPLRESLALLVRMSELIAEELRSRVDGFTEVRLERVELIQVRPYWAPSEPLPWPEPELRPLADFRALAERLLPDEVLARVDADPCDPQQLAQLARAFGHTGAYPEIVAGQLRVRPAAAGRARLRTVQCSLTDPVAFAAGDVALFPEVPGWSARDVTRRAVVEHRAWLAARPHAANGETLGRLATAARAALFHQSVEDGAPVLPLTVAAALGPLDESARDAYEAFGVHGHEPPPAVVEAFEQTVLELPAYRS